MSHNIFVPNVNKKEVNSSDNKVNSFLNKVSVLIFVVTFGLLPILFIPNIATPLGFTKSFLVVLGVFVITVLLSLRMLRSGSIQIFIPLSLFLFAGLVIMALASSLLSGDKVDSLYGNVMEVHTALFLTLMAVVMYVGFLFGKYKSVVGRLTMFIYGSSLVLLLVHMFRLFLGPDFLSFSLFVSKTHSYIGSLNDLALFSGLLVIITTLMLVGVIKSVVSKLYSILVLFAALSIMMVVNFEMVWKAVSVFGVLMLLYLLTRGFWLDSDSHESKAMLKIPLLITSVVTIFSLAFIISGERLGIAVSEATGVSYMEVRPSIDATAGIMKSVYSENAFLGTGPNRFEDAWRQYKDPIINQTEFWSTDFTAGSGFVPTLFVTTGVVGAALFVLFLLSFLYTGFRTLFLSGINNDQWYLIAVIAYVSAIYLWFMAIFYVPGSTIMIYTALATGLALAVYSKTVSKLTIDIAVTRNKHQAVLLMIFFIVTVIFSSSTVFGISKQYMSQTVYADTVINSSTMQLQEIDVNLEKSQKLFEQDTFLVERARLRLIEVNNLLGNPEPSEEEKQRFIAVIAEGISLTEKAISLDPTNPFNYALLSSFYSLLNPTEADEIWARRQEAIDQLSRLDPTNPSYHVLFAQLFARFGDFASARESLNKAITLKTNYTDALFLLSQLDIQEGNTEDAIRVTRSIVEIEPFNPTRHFQLGVLLSADNDLNGAARSFEQAIALDNNYANARYFLALAYLDLDKKEEALEQLKFIQVTNSDNQNLNQLIQRVENGDVVKPGTGFETPVNDGSVVEQDGDVTTSTKVPDTNLVTPLNQGGAEGEIEGSSENVIEEVVTEPAAGTDNSE